MFKKIKRNCDTNVSAKSRGYFYVKGKTGFTITELAIVIGVIAILIAVIVPTFTSILKKAEESAGLQNSANNYTNYVIGEDFELTAPLTSYYDIISIEAPALYTTYTTNKERTSSSDESRFYTTADYYVGDDNEFIFEPTLTVRHKVTYEIMTLTNYDTEVSVSIYNDGNTQATELEGKSITDTTIGYYSKDTDNTLYVIYNTETYGFQFIPNVATGKSFTLSMTLVDPYVDPDTKTQEDLDSDYIGNTIDASTMTVTVADGWNVYNATDLGRMCITSSSFSADNYTCGKSKANVYYNSTSSNMERLYYSTVWKNYLINKYGETALYRYGDTSLEPVNGVFIHANITVTNDDIPAEYIVTEAEAKAKSVNYSDMVGSLRDWSLLYIHYMEDSDFTFNGNLFKLDFSNLKWGQMNTSDSAAVSYYTEGQSTRSAGHSSAIAFDGLTSDNQYTVTFVNVESTGNTNGVNNTTDSSGLGASGSLMFVKSIHTTVKVTNSITKNFLIGYYSEITPSNYSSSNPLVTGTSSTDTSSTYYGLVITNTKVFDCYNSGVFAWLSTNNKIESSTMKRFGGPAVLLVSDADGSYNLGATSSGYEIDSTSVIESNVVGTESWFALNGATTIANTLTDLDKMFNYYGKTFLNDDGELNLYAVIMDHAYLGASNKDVYGSFTYGSSGGLTIDSSYINTYSQILKTNYAPLVVTNNNHVYFINNNSGYSLYTTSNEAADQSSAFDSSDTILYLYYPYTASTNDHRNFVVALQLSDYTSQ